MTPILTGIVASGISGHLTPPWSPEGGYDALATVTVPSGGASSVTFNGIPTGYKHLQIRAIGRSTFNAEIVDTYWTFNKDTSSNYFGQHQIRGNGSSATAAADNATTSSRVFVTPALTTLSNTFSAGIIDILDYANTNKYKTIRSLNAVDGNGTGSVWFRSSLWMNTSAINSITINPEPTSSFTQYSQFALYGVK